MKTISSRENARYKEWKLLAGSQAARRKAGMTLLDGVHLCAAFLEHRGQPEHCLVQEDALGHPEVAPLVARCREMGANCVVLPRALYQALSQVEQGVGISFVIRMPQSALPAHLNQSAVMLDGVQDPGNLGSILRSAAAAGIRTVICGEGTVAAWSPKVLRAGMGAHFLLTIVESADLASVLAGADIAVLATSSHAERPIYEADLSGPVIWLFGNEGQGVSPSLLARATVQVAIPHPGAVESLNVAACAAVCLFEQVRQQRQIPAQRTTDS